MEIDLDQTRQVYTVGELTRRVRFLLEDEFSSVWVEGELSGFTHHNSGHMYFTIKDQDATLQCVMFRRENLKLRFRPEGGLKVVCHGRISVYPPRGQYQLMVDAMEPKGLGALQLAFEQLKEKLFKEGLFDEERKKSIPYLPLRIGIITSPTGAVIHDMKHILERRFPDVHLVVSPVQVQGPKAKFDLVRALEDFNEYEKVDVVILARGGGSLEDLWPFNEEMVARAIAASEIPVISAVGHEVDYTISDFVADLRAPTPSAAAEIVLPEKKELVARLQDWKKRLRQALKDEVQHLKERLEETLKSKTLTQPLSLLDERWQALDELKKELQVSLSRSLDLKKRELKAVVGKLGVLSPLASLGRGYSIVFDEEHQTIIKSTVGLSPKDRVWVRVSDGEFLSEVQKVSNKEVGKDIHDSSKRTNL